MVTGLHQKVLCTLKPVDLQVICVVEFMELLDASSAVISFLNCTRNRGLGCLLDLFGERVSSNGPASRSRDK